MLLGHSGSGKTSLAEAMLYTTKAIGRMGRVEDGNTVSDFDPEEHKRQTSLQLSIVPCVWNGTKINVIDTPGYADFVGETISALRAADAAVVVISALGGVEVGTELMWQRIRELNLPTIIFVTKVDREHADYDGVMDQIREKLGNRCAAFNLPIGQETSFAGVVGLLGDAGPPELENAVLAARDELAESIAETDDDLTLKFLDEGTLSDSEIGAGLKLGVGSSAVFPILAGSGHSPGGIEQLLDAIVSYFPSPAEVPSVSAVKGDISVELDADATGPLAALVFKTSADPFVGKLSYFRVFRGTFTANSEVLDAATGETERISQVFVPVGKHQEPVAALAVGDIGAVAKLAHTVTGNTLTSKAERLAITAVSYPEAVYSVAIHPKSKADLDKLSSSLNRLLEEDPSLHLTREQSTGEMIVTGLGDTHVEVMADRARRKFGVDVDLALPRVAYRETIGATTKVEYKHKKQSGGHGQYGHVLLRIEPMDRGGGFEFASEVVGGNVPREYVPAVEKGVHKTMEEGAVAGYPIVDVRVVLTDGSAHSVDSSGQSFEIASSMAMKKGMQDANPVLLEPVMRVTITAPEQFAGTVVSDLNTRRGHISGMSPDAGVAVIEAEVPQSEAQQYATQLRALTQGRGSMNIRFDHYGEVPNHMVSKIVAGGDAPKG